MTSEFCTLFDRAYLPRGLTLHASLQRHARDFRLRVLCMDDETYEVLRQLQLDRLEPIHLRELEEHDHELLAVKPTRTMIEYYWTATPALSLFCLEREPELAEITYLDADLMFFSDPRSIYEELGGDSVLIVPHRFAPRWQPHVETSGVYNVEFMTFRRSADGLAALGWWRDRCLEWCYYRFEDGKMGDQKYLDDWPERFHGVHVLQHPGGGLAPWNVSRYRLQDVDGVVRVDDVPLIFYHYHSLRLYTGLDALARFRALPRPLRVTADGGAPIVWSSGYPVSTTERRLIWDPYVEQLARAFDSVRTIEPGFDAGFVHRTPYELVAETLRRMVVQPPLRTLARARAALARLGSAGRDGWRSGGVARQMADLAEQQLREPLAVAPYRAFLDSVGTLVDEYPLPAPASFLDFGCGTGHYSQLLADHFPGRFEYTGCDYSAAMVEEARTRWPGRRFVVNDVLANTLDLDTYDVICASALVDVIPAYRPALDVLLGTGARYVLLHRQQMTDGPSLVEQAPGYRGQTTHRVRLNLDDLKDVAAAHGRSLERTFHVEGDIFSFLFVRGTA